MTLTSLTTHKIRQHHIARSSMATYLRHSLPKLYAQIVAQTSFLDKFATALKPISLYERLYCIEHCFNDRPKCQHCHNEYTRSFDLRKDAYSKWCSARCQASDPECITKSKQTRLSLYGNENYSNAEQRSKTIKQHCIENPNYWQDRVAKSKATKNQRYGSVSYVNTEKIKETMHRHECEDPDFWKKREEKSMQTKFKNGHDPNGITEKKLSRHA